ncbi:MAG: hypothetical protein GYA33_02075 [Thermogutta sp.]|nr:hypothetical protein [Thermogutta sp.]
MFPFGFRVLGRTSASRRPVNWDKAFAAYCQCDPRADLVAPAWMSAFRFGEDFRSYLESHGTTKGYAGPTWSQWLWFDIDAEHIGFAADGTRRLVEAIANRYGVGPDNLLLFFSGRKGFHVGVPLSLCGSPPPSNEFHRTCRGLAEHLAMIAGVEIDAGIYDRIRLLRSPNSRHEKTGLHKVHTRFAELSDPIRVLEKAKAPFPVTLPPFPPPNPTAVDDWSGAEQETRAEADGKAAFRTDGEGRLNRLTKELIRGSLPSVGDRHRMLFSSAANLAEHGVPGSVIRELLLDPGLDCGLPPAEVERQIKCGIEHGSRGRKD